MYFKCYTLIFVKNYMFICNSSKTKTFDVKVFLAFFHNPYTYHKCCVDVLVYDPRQGSTCCNNASSVFVVSDNFSVVAFILLANF